VEDEPATKDNMEEGEDRKINNWDKARDKG
jgi:hypothetical protein